MNTTPSRRLYALLHRIDPPEEVDWPTLLLRWDDRKKPANLRNRATLARDTRAIRTYVLRYEIGAVRRRRLLTEIRTEHRRMVQEYLRAEAMIRPHLETAQQMQAAGIGGIQ